MRGLAALQAQQWREQVCAALLLLSLSFGMVMGGIMALFGIAGALVLYALAVCQQQRLVPVTRPAAIFGVAFLLLVLLADIAPVSPTRSWAMTGRLASMVLPLMLLFHADFGRYVWPRWVRQVPWVMLAVLALLLPEMLSNGQLLLPWLHGKDERLIYYNRGLSYAAVLVWPLVGLLRAQGRGRLALLLVGALLVIAWLSSSRGAPLALAVGGGFYLLAGRWPKLAAAGGWLLLAVVAGGILLLTPWLFAAHSGWLGHIPPSWHHRFEIWDYMLQGRRSCPFVGCGVDAAGIMPVQSPHQALYVYATGPAAHPHQMFLQLLLELGAGGWLWGVALCAFAWHGLQNWPAAARRGGMACWAALLTLACGAFSLWTDSFWAVAALAWLFAAYGKEKVNETDRLIAT